MSLAQDGPEISADFHASKLLQPEQIEREFDRLKPWYSKFVINGRSYGGTHEVDEGRVAEFFREFPNVETILELGSFEGLQTFLLAQGTFVKKVVAVEGRTENLQKALAVQQILVANKVNFVQGNLETIDLSTLGSFDAVFCVGVLYHLPKPWDLLRRISKVTKRVFIVTHYADENEGDVIEDDYRGIWYREKGMTDVLSGLSAVSFWPTLGSLVTMLYRCGFSTFHLIHDDKAHQHGPMIHLAAWVS